MTTPWKTLINYIQNGERVEAGTPNRPLSEIVQRTQYLKDVLDLLSAGSALFRHDISIEPDAQVGQFVYWNDTTQRYERGLAALEFDAVGGYYVPAKSSYIVGMVYAKSSSNIADLLLVGSVTGFDFTNTFDYVGDAPPGPYYLSSRVPGKLVTQKPPISVYALYYNGDNAGQIQVVMKDIIESHVHYRFELTAEPAGLLNDAYEGQHVEIILADPDLPGWLPADHIVFGGLAPTGAKFGYNFTQQEDLWDLWPPVPVGSAYLEVNGRGVDDTEDGRVIINLNGIWWMNDCYGSTPWPPDYSPSSASSSSSSTDPACAVIPLDFRDPLDRTEMIMMLWYSRMVYKTNSALVTSLQPADGSPIKVLDALGDPATFGDLYLALDFSFTDGAQDETGSTVVKIIEGTTVKRGKVIEKIKSLSDQLTISGDDAGSGYVQGAVTVTFNQLDATSYGPTELVALQGAREELYSGNLFISLLADRETGFIGRIDVPTFGLPTGPKMSIVFWELGLGDGTLPPLTLVYRRQPMPAAGESQQIIVTDTALSDIEGGVITENHYKLVGSDEFTIAAGDIIFFTLTRAGSDGYSPKVGILRQMYAIGGSS